MHRGQGETCPGARLCGRSTVRGLPRDPVMRIKRESPRMEETNQPFGRLRNVSRALAPTSGLRPLSLATPIGPGYS